MFSSSLSRVGTAFVSFVLLGFVTGCGGGGGVSPVTVAPTTAPATTAPSSSGSAKATFVITWPTTTGSTGTSRSRSISARSAVRAAGTRKPDYISPSTTSITISVNGGTATTVPNPNTFTTATNQPTTTVVVDAPVGTDTFTVNDFDTTSNLLASNSISYPIVIDHANVVPITLNGNLGKVACLAVGPFVTGTTAPFAEVGPAGQLSILPEDDDGNIIFAPGNVPAVTLSAASPGMGGAVTSTSTPNLFTINPQVVGTPVTYNATGTNLAGMTVSSTCSVTRQLAMYVTNHYNNIVGSTQASTAAQSASVTIYPASATGSATPTATIAGTNTQLAAVQFVAVDPKGNVFVTNQGPAPGATYGPTSGFVSIYGAGTYGNVAPVGTIANLNTPEGIAFDSTGLLYVLSIDRIQEYPPTANGLTAAAAPSNTISGGATDLFSCYGLAVGADFTVGTACSDVANVFSPHAMGNAAPGIIELPTMTAMTFASDSWIGASIDSAGNFALPGANNNQDNVSIYAQTNFPAPGSSSSPAVVTSPAGMTVLNQPFGIANDVNGAYYVANYGNSTIATFTSETTLQLGTGTSNALTGLDHPYGIAVR